jgi:hypothetical protein
MGASALGNITGESTLLFWCLLVSLAFTVFTNVRINPVEVFRTWVYLREGMGLTHGWLALVDRLPLLVVDLATVPCRCM